MTDSNKDLEKTILELNKKFGINTIGKIGEMPTIKMDRISSGSSYLDWAIGGGWPLGRVIELYGNPSSGKSLISMRTAAEFQKLGKKVVLIDSENAFDPEFAKKLGVDTNELVLSQMSSGEFVFDMVDKLLETDVGLIIIDSVASLVPNYETDNEMDKQTIGVQARLMSKALRKINGKANKNKTLIIFINQIREKVGVMYGNPEITSGGRALAFYSSIRLEVKRGDFLKENESTVGHQVKFRVTKSKVCSPFKDGYFCFYYPDDNWTDGIKLFDDADELVSMLLINKKITRRGAWYDAGGESFQGREKLEEKIREDIKFKELLTKL